MRHISSFSILLLVLFLMNLNTVSAHVQNVKATVVNISKEKKMFAEGGIKIPDMSQTAIPVTQPEEHSKKPHVLKMDELAHIHHFHKERVKKLKRHHKKCWVLSKLILILCHLVLLVCAFMHFAH